MGRMDGDGICMGNEFVATPVGSAMTLESQHDEIRRLKADRDEWKAAFNAKCLDLAAALSEVERLRHQAGEARKQPARSAEVEMYRRALRALIELL